ncbi:mitochondrial intermembrane space import and assembly protein 40-B-like [Montipora capricornis]|uniref:mitochondrial intermembrane space import and assembly protein 40-B-like n=1 Tax=Montipora capricornis TaxID=246305 RepID=UPI0035F0FD60
MSYCREEGKDKLIFVTEEDHAVPSTVTLAEDEEDEMEGLIKANGEINWDCPCLQGMAYGPCGEQFKSAFSCFHYSEAEPKGSDCIPQFRDMQECFVKYPEIYGKDDDEILEDDEELKDDETQRTKATVEIATNEESLHVSNSSSTEGDSSLGAKSGS